MSQSPLVSIITPVYNRSEDLPRMIESVFIQTYSNWELILVDDGSDDGSTDIAREWTKRDTRIKALTRNRQPKGASTCRNIALKQANGKFLMFLDSDDFLAPQCLQRRVHLIEEEDFIVTQTGIIRHENKEIRKLWNSLKHEDDLVAFVQLEGWCISSTFFNAEFVKKYQFDENAPSLQDWGFHMNILMDQPQYVKFPDSDPDVYVRSGHGRTRISITTNNYNRIDSRFHIFLEMEQRLSVKAERSLSYLLDKQYLKHLNLAVLQFNKEEFKSLYRLWAKSLSFQTRNGLLMRLYLKLQFGLRLLGMNFLHGLVYRCSRFVYPDRLFGPNKREVVLIKPLIVEDELQPLLDPNF